MLVFVFSIGLVLEMRDESGGGGTVCTSHKASKQVLEASEKSKSKLKMCKNMYGSGRITELRLNVILFIIGIRNCVPVHFSTGLGYFSMILSYVFRVQSVPTPKVKPHKEGLLKYP